jgi:hypothetical protein
MSTEIRCAALGHEETVQIGNLAGYDDPRLYLLVMATSHLTRPCD